MNGRQGGNDYNNRVAADPLGFKSVIDTCLMTNSIHQRPLQTRSYSKHATGAFLLRRTWRSYPFPFYHLQ